MKRIEISVKNRVAWQTNSMDYICGNGDFVIGFVFDSEWDEHETKTARFIHNGEHTDIVFTGSECEVPKILGAKRMEVGVFAGNLYTTTPAIVKCKKSILCDGGAPADPTPDVYAQLMEMMEGFTGVDPETVAEAVNDYMEKNPVTVKETDPTVPAWAKAETKPSYTAAEVGALPANTEIPSVDGLASETYVKNYAQPKGNYALKGDIPTVPTAVSAFTNDKGYQTEAEVNALINTALGVIENGTY